MDPLNSITIVSSLIGVDRVAKPTSPSHAGGNPFLGSESDLVIVSLDTLTGELTFGALAVRGETPRCTENGDAPAEQGEKRENTGSI